MLCPGNLWKRVWHPAKTRAEIDGGNGGSSKQSGGSSKNAGLVKGAAAAGAAGLLGAAVGWLIRRRAAHLLAAGLRLLGLAPQVSSMSEIGDKLPADLEVDTSWRAGKRVVPRDAQIETSGKLELEPRPTPPLPPYSVPPVPAACLVIGNPGSGPDWTTSPSASP